MTIKQNAGQPRWLITRLTREITNGWTAECANCGRRVPESMIEGHGGRTWLPVCKTCCNQGTPPETRPVFREEHVHDAAELAFAALARLVAINASMRAARIHQQRRSRKTAPMERGRA